jgi:Exopolysaccharide biosynthesis protein YbjH
LIGLLCVVHSVYADRDDLIMTCLKNAGYENLKVVSKQDTLFVCFENRKYRWDIKAIAEVLSLVMPKMEQNLVLSMIPLKRGLPILKFSIPVKQYWRFVRGEIPSGKFMGSLNVSYNIDLKNIYQASVSPSNPTFNKFDIVVHPQIRAQFGNYSDPIESQINIAPAINVSFWKGMDLTTQIIFPLQNDLKKEGDYIRPGLLTINQLIRLPLNSFASVSAGYFTKNRYGANLETRKYFLNGKIALGLSCGYTGFVKVLDGRWAYSEVDLLSWDANVAYRYARYDLTVKLGYASYLNEDKGWRFDFYRQFGEVNIGFYALKTEGVLNGGFNFIIPIPPRKYNTKRIVRIRSASSFAWEYRAKGLTDNGRAYQTGNELDRLFMFYNPDYIKKQLIIQLMNDNK